MRHLGQAEVPLVPGFPCGGMGQFLGDDRPQQPSILMFTNIFYHNQSPSSGIWMRPVHITSPFWWWRLVFSGVAQEVMICSMRASSFGFLVETEDLKGKNYWQPQRLMVKKKVPCKCVCFFVSAQIQTTERESKSFILPVRLDVKPQSGIFWVRVSPPKIGDLAVSCR